MKHMRAVRILCNYALLKDKKIQPGDLAPADYIQESVDQHAKYFDLLKDEIRDMLDENDGSLDLVEFIFDLAVKTIR